MKLNELLPELGAHIGLENLSFDADGTCRLIFDDTTNVDLEVHPDDEHLLVMRTVVCATPPDNRLPFYRKLLAGHVLGIETNGGTFGLDESSGDIVLWNTMHGDNATVELLSDKLTGLVRMSREWAERLNSTTDGSGVGHPMDVMLTGMIRV